MYLLVVLHIIRFVKNAFLNIDAFHSKNENILLLNMCFYKVIKLKYGKYESSYYIFFHFEISFTCVTFLYDYYLLCYEVEFGVTLQLYIVCRTSRSS